jgi:GWxTD domain-containing protein
MLCKADISALPMNSVTISLQKIPSCMNKAFAYPAVMLLIFLIPATELLAQRITYEYLRVRDRQPAVFFEQLVIPDTSQHGMKLVTTFRMENNFLSFRRLREEQSGEQVRRFYAEPSVQVSIRERGSEPTDGVQAPQAAILNWSETVYAETYEQTQSATTFLQNMLTTDLEPGSYRVENTARSNSRTRRSVAPSMRVPDPGDADAAFLYFLDQADRPEPPFTAPLMNMGHNVFFGRDHQLLVWVPSPVEEAAYSLEIHKLRISRQDTTVRDRVMEFPLDADNEFRGYIHHISMSGERPQLSLQPVESGTADTGVFYLLKVPNSTFENAPYRVRVMKTPSGDDAQVIARRTYQSLWLDMPVSLLNLDVAINMMRFIVDDDQHRELRRGNRQQREERFRRFWAERDPTPDKEYNELMVEYFRRIDFAFDHFTTPQSPGYDSDQGRVYIRQGEPDRRERTFPPNQPAREIWHYGDRSYVFEATTGFGDYRLIDRR